MRGVDFLECAVASCGTGCEAVGGGDEAGRVKAEGGQVLRRGGCEGRGRDESIRSEQASGVGVGGGRAGETRRGDAGQWVGETRSPLRQAGNSNHGGAGRADFAKVSPSQRGAGEMHPLGAGGALQRSLTYLERANGARVTWEAPRWT